jgi:hypothetical protein
MNNSTHETPHPIALMPIATASVSQPGFSISPNPSLVLASESPSRFAPIAVAPARGPFTLCLTRHRLMSDIIGLNSALLTLRKRPECS